MKSLLFKRDERVLGSREICMRYYSGDVKFASFRASALAIYREKNNDYYSLHDAEFIYSINVNAGLDTRRDKWACFSLTCIDITSVRSLIFCFQLKRKAERIDIYLKFNTSFCDIDKIRDKNANR